MKNYIYFFVLVCLHTHFMHAITNQQRRERNRTAWLKRDGYKSDVLLTHEEKKWAVSYQNELDFNKIRYEKYQVKQKANLKDSTLNKHAYDKYRDYKTLTKKELLQVQAYKKHLQSQVSQQAFENQSSLQQDCEITESDIEDAVETCIFVNMKNAASLTNNSSDAFKNHLSK